ncbi:MAG TPA: sulfite oxidase [Candidatus Limnocylindria bacterium]|nr:sulfite oxidase [Candidatus Limnocylindria bacterium]
MRGIDRRAFLRMLAGAAPAGLGLLLGPRALRAAGPAEMIERNEWPEHWETTLDALGRSWLTRNDRFFVRSHLPVPDVDPASYRLEITGLVGAPLSLTLDELKELPRIEMPCTFECAGNGRGLLSPPNTAGTQWARGAVGNARWGGAPLATLLRRAGVLPEGRHVWFEAADRAPHPDVPAFLRSIPIEKAMQDALLAYDMNGEALPKLHGAPLRAIVPGWYGMASTKWVTRVRVENQPSDNHFMARGYRYNRPGEDPTLAAPIEEMRIKSVVTWPRDGAKLPLAKFRAQGFAWAGSPGVKRVDVSSDGGTSWRPAGFMGETVPHAWRSWTTEIDVKSPRRLTLMARATDGNGRQQPVEASVNAGGYANNSIHRITIHVRG